MNNIHVTQGKLSTVYIKLTININKRFRGLLPLINVQVHQQGTVSLVHADTPVFSQNAIRSIGFKGHSVQHKITQWHCSLLNLGEYQDAAVIQEINSKFWTPIVY